MGCVYQRRVCRTCKGGSKLKACEAAGHEIVTLPIWWIKYRQNGKSHCETSGSEKKTDAKELLKRREGDISHGRPVSPKVGRLTFQDAAQDLINDYKANGKKTLNDVQRRIEKHLASFFGSRKLASITTADVRAYIAKRQDDTIVVRKARQIEKNGRVSEIPEECRPVSRAEINRELTALKRMFSLAIEAEKLTHRPKIPMLQENNTRQGFFERHEYEAVLRHLPEAIRPVITFAYLTGWRINSEVLPLEWRQVDRQAGEVRLDPGTTKNRQGRVIYFSPELRALFDERWQEHERLKKAGRIVPLVFHRNGKAIRSIRIAWQKACRDAGCPGRIPHDLRRTAVRNLVRNGVPEDVAMKVTGHRTRSVFTRYNVTSDGDLRAAALRMDGGYTLATLGAEQGRRTKRRAQIS